jgi:Flp pilus assembly protein TadD
MQNPSQSGLMEPPPDDWKVLLLVEQVAFLVSCEDFEEALQVVLKAVSSKIQSADLLNLAGICSVRMGDHAQAEKFWHQAIAMAPNAAQPHANIGIMLAELGRDEQAEHHYRQAIALDPSNAETCFSVGIFLSNRGRHTDAEQLYRQAIALEPANAGMYGNLAVLLADRMRNEEAERCYLQAIALDPSDDSFWSNLGTLFASQNRDEEAERSYRHAVMLNPASAKAYSNLGILLAKHGQSFKAEQAYRNAIALAPDHAETQNNLGLLLESLGRDQEAEACHRKALTLKPRSSPIHSNLGNLLARKQLNAEAEQCYRDAIELKPDSAIAHSNLGVLLADCQRVAEAEASFRHAIAGDAFYPLAKRNLAQLLLFQGRLSEGWIYHEARYDSALPDVDAPLPNLPGAQWWGESLLGKSLLVWPEQGLGDMIQFCRYLPLLKKQGTTHITLVCRHELKTLMSTLSGVDLVLSLGETSLLPEHDYWTLPMSLPLHFKTDLATIPDQLPYLFAERERIARWSLRLPKQGLRVGLVWKGNPMHSNDSHRSLPGLSALAPLWKVPRVHFISLQTASPPETVADDNLLPILNLGDDILDFADTAAIVQQLDLMISVDTSVAHLAGALGMPCWVLLPARKTDWRWMAERLDSPWYPGVMRLFRQKKIGDWVLPVAQLAGALREFVAMSGQHR